MEIVKEKAVEREEGYIYYIDDDGNICRANKEEEEIFEEENGEEDYGISNDGWDEMPRIVKGKDGEEFSQDILGITPVGACKIYGLKNENLPNYIEDDVEYTLYYEKKGYASLGGISNESRVMKFKRKI